MRIFDKIQQLIKDEPEYSYKGTFLREDMDEKDLEYLKEWTPLGEGEFEKDGFTIIIESKNTR